MLKTSNAVSLVGMGKPQESTMHRMTILADCLIDGEHKAVGEIVEVSTEARDFLLESGRGALALVEPAAPASKKAAS